MRQDLSDLHLHSLPPYANKLHCDRSQIGRSDGLNKQGVGEPLTGDPGELFIFTPNKRGLWPIYCSQGKVLQFF